MALPKLDSFLIPCDNYFLSESQRIDKSVPWAIVGQTDEPMSSLTRILVNKTSSHRLVSQRTLRLERICENLLAQCHRNRLLKTPWNYILPHFHQEQISCLLKPSLIWQDLRRTSNKKFPPMWVLLSVSHIQHIRRLSNLQHYMRIGSIRYNLSKLNIIVFIY